MVGGMKTSPGYDASVTGRAKGGLGIDFSSNRRGPASIIAKASSKRRAGKSHGFRIGIGIDIERVERFRGATKADTRLLTRVFSERERAYCRAKADPAVHFAGTFAAKEAALKAMSSLYEGSFTISDFVVTHASGGAPEVRYSGKDSMVRDGLTIEISISHTAENAVAMAVAMRT